MRQFVYDSAAIGLKEWPPGTLRLADIEVTTDPECADVFVTPGSLRIFERSSGVLDMDKLNRLPYFKGNESRHVFFDVSDNFTEPINLPIIFIRCDVRSWMLPHDPNTIQMAWPVEDYSECIEVPSGGFKYDVSFHGWLSGWVDKDGLQVSPRRDSSDACKNDPRLKCDIAQYSDFTGYCYHLPEGIRRRAEFRRSMRESRVCLCPESISGVLPYRFFEAMSAGRVPLLVGSDYVLPWANRIPYDDFILRCPSELAGNANHRAALFIKETSDQLIIEKGRQARYWWKQLLDSRDWPRLHSLAITEKLGVLQAV